MLSRAAMWMCGREWSAGVQRGLVLMLAFASVSVSSSACVGTSPAGRSSDGGSPVERPLEVEINGEADAPEADSGVTIQPVPIIPADEEPARAEPEEEVPAIDAGVVPSTPDAIAAQDAGDSDPCNNEDIRFAKGVALSELALYQAVKVSLVSAGSLVSVRDAPIVQGKRALVRVFVRPDDGFVARTLRAVLTVDNGTVQRFVSELEVRGASRDAELTSTFNFELDGATVGPRTTLRATLLEPLCGGELGTAENARAPVSGTVRLDAEAIQKLRVHVVPTVIDGNTASPSQQQLAQMHDILLAHYPVPEVEISVHEPVDLSSAWSCASGNGWSCALDAVVALRAREAPPANVYYYAVLTPEATYSAYCAGGCTLGVAYGNVNGSPRYQVGLGVGYTNELTYHTMVHELGHAHGRPHAPCAPGKALDPSSLDADYPSSTADTVSWGWDSRNDAMHPPTDKDVMSYCNPHWISSYTYSAIAQRSEAVNISAFVYGGAPARGTGGEIYRNLIVASGGASFGELSEEGTPPGEPITADVLGWSGSLLRRVIVYRALLSDETSMFLFVPSLPVGARTLRFAGRTVALP